MIAKKVRNPKKSSSKASRIQGLMDYIREPHKDGKEKNVYDNVRNFYSAEKAFHVQEMQDLAHTAVRSKDPINHYVFSWQQGERPSEKQVERAVTLVLKELKMEEHQAAYALHRNTQHCHLHLVVNRVYPETGKVVLPNRGKDIELIHRAVARIEHEQSWKKELHARYRVNDKGEVERTSLLKERPQPRSEKKDREVRTGVKSAERIAIEVGAPVMKAARSWRELHANLGKEGLRFERKGSGAVLFVGEIPVKASVVGREFSLGNLQKRLGSFEAAPPSQRISPRAPEAMKEGAEGELAQQNASRAQQKQAEAKALRERHAQERKTFSQENQDKHHDLLQRQDWKGKGQELNQLRRQLAQENQAAQVQLRARHLQEKKALQEKWRPQPETTRAEISPERKAEVLAHMRERGAQLRQQRAAALAQERAQGAPKPVLEKTQGKNPQASEPVQEKVLEQANELSAAGKASTPKPKESERLPPAPERGKGRDRGGPER